MSKPRILNVTNSTEQSPSWDANSHSANEEIPQLLCDLKANYRVYNNMPLAPTLSQMNPVPTFPSYFNKIRLGSYPCQDFRGLLQFL